MSAAAFWLVAALLTQGGIAFLLLLRLGAVRVPLVTSGKLRVEDVALSRERWPDNVQKVSNAFDNQFQLPVLFYVACGLSLYFGPLWFEAVLAWLFVGSRIVHAIIHITTNRVEHRFTAYAIGFFVLAALWIDLVIRLLLVGIGA